MNIQDTKTTENIDFKQRERTFIHQAALILGDEFNPESDGVVMSRSNHEDPAKDKLMQEYHNSGHALWYLSMVVHMVIYGKPSSGIDKKVKRILAHLICLREFIQTENYRLRLLVGRLLDELLIHMPDDQPKWSKFIYGHWQLIRDLAQHYGSHDKCFPMKDYEKVCDVVEGKKHRKLWWWKLKITNLGRNVVCGVKRLTSSINEKLKAGFFANDCASQEN